MLHTDDEKAEKQWLSAIPYFRAEENTKSIISTDKETVILYKNDGDFDISVKYN